jgi:hypothetical protein
MPAATSPANATLAIATRTTMVRDSREREDLRFRARRIASWRVPARVIGPGWMTAIAPLNATGVAALLRN